MKPATMMIDDVKYVREDSISKENNSGPKDIRIIILPRGWNIVGEYKRDGDRVFVNNCSVIRRWGTTQGLGQIAKNGPTKETKLDPCEGEVELNDINIISTIKCEYKKW
jgi:hypothetical protein